jgi:secreted Zn-dependent insulinase-like peptidase
LLKKKNWATSLIAGPGVDCRGFATFKIAVGLTQEGLANSDNVICHVHEVTLDTFYDEGAFIAAFCIKAFFDNYYFYLISTSICSKAKGFRNGIGRKSKTRLQSDTVLEKKFTLRV